MTQKYLNNNKYDNNKNIEKNTKNEFLNIKPSQEIKKPIDNLKVSAKDYYKKVIEKLNPPYFSDSLKALEWLEENIKDENSLSYKILALVVGGKVDVKKKQEFIIDAAAKDYAKKEKKFF